MDELNRHLMPLKDLRSKVDDLYVGFHPNGSSVKPVHIANGCQRILLERFMQQEGVIDLGFVNTNKGENITGHSNEEIFKKLLSEDKLDENTSKSDFIAMRGIMQKLLNADHGVFISKKGHSSSDMISYSAGSDLFVTSKSIYQDSGEFIGAIIQKFCPKLSTYIKDILSQRNDPITSLFNPVISDASSQITVSAPSSYSELPIFSQYLTNPKIASFVSSIETTGLCLFENLKRQPNTLKQLRIFNLYCIFQLIRYIALLESFYLSDVSSHPFLIDFINDSKKSITRASTTSYSQISRSISRIYAWAFARELKKEQFTINELMVEPTPLIKKAPSTKKSSKKSSKNASEIKQIWDIAKSTAKAKTLEDEKYLAFGSAIYDMISLEADSNPEKWLKALGALSGIIYPPSSSKPNKRFVISQDVIEMLLLCTVSSNNTIGQREFCNRLYEGFNIIVGGNADDYDRLKNSGAILQVDENSLQENFSSMTQVLEDLDFAESMADGILQIRLGGKEQ